MQLNAIPQFLNPVLFFDRPLSGKCPKCGKRVIEYSKAFSCESGKDGCGFVIWKSIAGKAISNIQAKRILEQGKSTLLKGFTSKAGKKFDAYLVLKEDFHIGFEFPKVISRFIQEIWYNKISQNLYRQLG